MFVSRYNWPEDIFFFHMAREEVYYEIHEETLILRKIESICVYIFLTDHYIYAIQLDRNGIFKKKNAI